jgi:DNA-binding transcriptional ArsR family regulator
VLDASAAVQASSVLRAVNHKMRQEMIALIRDNAGITPTEIYLRLKLEQSVASQHLAQLRLAGIVTAKREGKNIRYYLNHARLEAVNQAMHLLAAA